MSIKDFIKTQTPFALEENELPFPIHKKRFKKNEIITSIGKTEDRVYFIINGILEINITVNGEGKIIDFFFENSFVCSLTSFLLQTKSEVELVALTAIEVEYINREDITKAYQTSLLANQLGRSIIEQAYLMKFQREKDFLTKSAEQRYMELLEKRPTLLKLLPVHKTAKYLGIHPESLSRIRKNIKS